MPNDGNSRRDRRDRQRNNPDPTRKIILAKKEGSSTPPDQQIVQQPKLLLKPKEPTEPAKSKPTEKGEDVKVETKEVEVPAARMMKPQPLLTGEHVLNVETFFSYVQEASTHFTVIGIVGLQNTGKSTLGNVLLNPANSFESFLDTENETFVTRGRKHVRRIAPVTEGIQMFISEDRLIVLDCEPFLVNHLHKEYILNELDEIKIIILLLNICHTLIVVENATINPSLMRLLVCAEMMKTQLKELGSDHCAMLTFIQNKAGKEALKPEALERRQHLYQLIMKSTALDINFLAFPDLRDFDTNRISDYDTVRQYVLECRKRVLMTKNVNFATQIPIFNEKIWLQMVAKAWEANGSNYFLKKYLSLKEKFNLLNHVSINDHSKGRSVYYPEEE